VKQEPNMMKRLIVGTVLALAVATSAFLTSSVLAAQKPKAKQKVTVCHKPTKQALTLEVGSPALKAHLGHGDTAGPCPGSPKK
jgi:hypothetical protein